MQKIFAPAKINLHLHVTGKRTDGYHLLDSLVCFADVGDHLIFEPATGFHFDIEGVFREKLTGNDIDSSPASSNTIVRAAWLLANTLARELNVRIILQKNIPTGAGLGGGSADAAACFWGLCKFWGITVPEELLYRLAVRIGSDVPVCLKSSAAIMRGIGDELSAGPDLPEIPAILVWPNISVPTQRIFQNYSTKNYSDPAVFSSHYTEYEKILLDLGKTSNDLMSVAASLYPAIQKAATEIEKTPGCYFTRMSGSGSTLFGLFKTEDQSRHACESIANAHPDWWVRSCWLNRATRY